MTWCRGVLSACLLLAYTACGDGGASSASNASHAPSTGGTASGTTPPSASAGSAAASTSASASAASTSSGPSRSAPAGTAGSTSTPAARSAQLTATAQSTGTFTIPEGSCEIDATQGQLRLQFGPSNSPESANLAMNTGYAGPGTYRGGGIIAFIAHAGHGWYTNGGDAVLSMDPGERTGRFSFTSQQPSTEPLSGSFVCP